MTTVRDKDNGLCRPDVYIHEELKQSVSFNLTIDI